MPIPRFSSVEEIRSVFDHNISISFVRPGSYEINTTTKKEIWKGEKRFLFEIIIGTVLGDFKRADSGIVTDLEEEQKATLIHELLHIFHFCTTGQGFGLTRGAFGLSSQDYELAIDNEVYHVVKTHDSLFRKIVNKLTAHPHCSFNYEINDTPFLSFHKMVVCDMLSRMAAQLVFGNPEQIKILHAARQLGLRI